MSTEQPTTGPTTDGDLRTGADLTRSEQRLLDEAWAWCEAAGGTGGSELFDRISSTSRGLVRRALATAPASAAIAAAARRLLDQFDPSGIEVAGPPFAAGDTLTAADRAVALARADQHARQIERRYRRLLGAQGAVTGAASINITTTLVALAGDVTATTLGLLQSAAETLAGYGVPGDLRAASIRTLLLSTEPDPDRRRHGLLLAAGVDRGEGFASDGPATEGREPLVEAFGAQAGPRVLIEALEGIVRRRAGRRVLVAVPAMGAVAGAATSVWMAKRTGTAARHVGRLAFLDRYAPLPPLPPPSSR